jgi:hypothetical protein
MGGGLLTCAKRVLGGVALRDHAGGTRLAGHRALDRLAGCVMTILRDRFNILGFPMDEHADADENVVGLGFRHGDSS